MTLRDLQTGQSGFSSLVAFLRQSRAMANPMPPSYSLETSRAMSPGVETMYERRMADFSTRTTTVASEAGGLLSDEEK